MCYVLPSMPWHSNNTQAIKWHTWMYLRVNREWDDICGGGDGVGTRAHWHITKDSATERRERHTINSFINYRHCLILYGVITMWLFVDFMLITAHIKERYGGTHNITPNAIDAWANLNTIYSDLNTILLIQSAFCTECVCVHYWIALSFRSGGKNGKYSWSNKVGYHLAPRFRCSSQL